MEKVYENISVIIISYNCKQYLVDCIKSIILTCYEFTPEIVIVDNNSDDGTVEYITNLFPEVKVIANKTNLGYAAAINIGVKESNGDFLLLSNADVIYKKNSINNLVSKVKELDCRVIVGPQQTFSNGDYQRSYGFFPSIKRGIFDLFAISKINQKIKEQRYKKKIIKDYYVDYIDGAAICTTRDIFNNLQGFDERYFFFSEESDFCYRARISNIKSVLTTESLIVHHRGGSQENSGMNEKSIMMIINSEALFIDIHHNSITKKIYFVLQLLFFRLLLIKSKLLNDKNRIENNKKYINAIKLVLNGK